MNLNYQKITILLAIFTITPYYQIWAQNLPADTHQPGYWQPVDRFDIKRSVEVQLVNDAGITLEYDLTDLESINPQILKAGETETLKKVSYSAHIVVYPTVSIDPNNSLVLRFNVKVEKDNKIIVTIKRGKTSKDDPNFLGHRAINLQKNGGIYLY